MSAEEWAAVSVIVGALLTLAGAIFKNAAESRKNAAETRRVDVQSISGIIDELQDARERDRKEIAHLREAQDADRKEIADLGERVTAMEKRYRAAIDYIRRLLSWIRLHLPDHVVPAPPDNIAEEL